MLNERVQSAPAPTHLNIEAPTIPAMAGPHVRPTRIFRVEPSGATNLGRGELLMYALVVFGLGGFGGKLGVWGIFVGDEYFSHWH